MSGISLIDPNASPKISQPRDLVSAAEDAVPAGGGSPRRTRCTVAGYTIRHCIGSGGYGEVWKADAPGGLEKAVKFVYGRLDDTRAACEMEALSRIKEVRHPFLLSLERIEVIDGQLVIVTELAEKSLKDRFDQCRAEGMPGIPRDELLIYLGDAADALDYMCERYSLQHLDVKPENLLIQGGRVKVADFGLVRQVHDHTVTMMGGLTPAYAPPESFRGHPDLHSDQYSLAIVYQEMLTGELPFPGRTAIQLAEQHQNSPPLLSTLPEQDRDAITKALSKIPGERFKNSRQLVEVLRNPQILASNESSNDQAFGGPGQKAAGHDARSPMGNADRRSPTALGPAGQSSELAGSSPPGSDSTKRRPIATVEMTTPGVPKSPEDRVGAVNMTLPPGERPLLDFDDLAAWHAVEPLEPIELDESETAVLHPTLVLGVGSVAGQVVTQYNRRLAGRFGALKMTPIFSSLILDSDRNTIRQLVKESGGDDRVPSVSWDDVLELPLRKPQDYRNESDELLSWISRRWLYNIPRSLQTEGLRPLGRLALVEQAERLRTMLTEKIKTITSAESLQTVRNHVETPIDPSRIRVLVVASICGGTGGGAVLDVAEMVRQTIESLTPEGEQHPNYDVTGMLLHSTPRDANRAELAKATSCATLAELAHFETLQQYPGDPTIKLAPRNGPMFEQAYVVHMGDSVDETTMQQSVDSVSHYMFLDAVTRTMRFFDRCRDDERQLAEQADQPRGLRIGTFGLRSIGCTKGEVPEVAAEILCGELFRRWRGRTNISGINSEDAEAGAQQVAQQIDSRELPPKEQFSDTNLDVIEAEVTVFQIDEMINSWVSENAFHAEGFHKLVENSIFDALKRTPEDLCKKISVEIVETIANVCSPDDMLDELFGKCGNEGKTAEEKATATDAAESFEYPRALDAALMSQVGNYTTQCQQWLNSLPNDKSVRVKGAIRVVKQLGKILTSIEEATVLEIRQSTAKTSELSLRIGDGKAQKKGLFSFGRRSDQEQKKRWGEMVSMRCHIMMLRGVGRLVRHLLAMLGSVTQEFRAMTDDLDALAEQFNVTDLWNEVSVQTHIENRLPNADDELQQRLVDLLRRRLPMLANQLDNRFRTTCFGENLGLADVLQGKGKTELKSAAMQAARAAIMSVLEEIDVADLLMPEFSTPELTDQLVRCVRESEPRLGNCGGRYRLAMVSPRGTAPDDLLETISKRCEQQLSVIQDAGTDIVLCHEMQGLPIDILIGHLASDRHDIIAAAGRLHTRIDIQWQPIAND